jgi:hypothetical protein
LHEHVEPRWRYDVPELAAAALATGPAKRVEAWEDAKGAVVSFAVDEKHGGMSIRRLIDNGTLPHIPPATTLPGQEGHRIPLPSPYLTLHGAMIWSVFPEHGSQGPGLDYAGEPLPTGPRMGPTMDPPPLALELSYRDIGGRLHRRKFVVQPCVSTASYSASKPDWQRAAQGFYAVAPWKQRKTFDPFLSASGVSRQKRPHTPTTQAI